MAFDIALICENGHKITGRLSARPELFVKYCKYCSAPTISKCECGAEIQGCLISNLHFPDNVPVPNYCHECGKPYPWTAKAIATCEKIINNESKLSKKEKQDLCKSIPDLINSTPESRLSAQKFKIAAQKMSADTLKLISEWCIEHACEVVIKTLGF